MNRIAPALTGTRRTIVFGAVLTVLAIAGTFGLDPYRNFQLATIVAYFCAVAGLTLLVGLTGQLSLGHAALMAVGGYAYALTANLATDWGLDGVPRFLLGMLGALVVSTVHGLLLGLAGARLQGPYLAGVTLAIAIALPAVTAQFSGVLGGDQGLQIAYEGVPEIFSRLIVVEQWHAWVSILIAGVVVTALAAVRRSALGLKMRAVRDDETAARLSGVPAARVKVIAFTLSSVAAGAGGAALCFVTQSISPGAYTLAFSLLLVVAAVVGGLGSIGGAALGAALIVLLPWLVGTVTDAFEMSADLEQRLSGNLGLLVFGGLLIVVMLARPGGLASIGLRRGRGRTAPPRSPSPFGPAASAAAPTDSPADEADTDRTGVKEVAVHVPTERER
ncbi:branched-chain amino acid ABC transporter permease [uncultured Demequina sp.]|uniref:branched-chain amino acid ABC transporter permease n=1 Tax=uncultured Demequina sp. TaxID=693499 RepID=UPI0025F82972|nr:branched-chain amino acid ABC transporter permease [uncultured Demequina sp.]